MKPRLKSKRKVWFRNVKGTSPAVAIPRWWLGDAEEVEIEVYPEFILIMHPDYKSDDIKKRLGLR